MSTYVTIVGTLGDDPILRFTQSGSAVCSFSVADGHSKKNKETGKWEDVGTTWYRVTAWEQLGQNVAESLEKGARVIVTGSLQNREWEDKEGGKRLSLEITAKEVGPSLRWATAEVSKAERTDNVTSSRAKPADDESPFS